MLKFYTTCVEQDIVLGGVYARNFFPCFKFIKYFLICTHLSHIKLNFFSALNFETLYLFKFFVLIFDQERQYLEHLFIEGDNIIKNIILDDH